MKNLLITTSIKDTWLIDSNYKKVFVSEACKLYSYKNCWSILDHEVLDYHWNDNVKLKKDYKYLGDLYEQLLISLTNRLNSYSNVNFPVIFWRIIIGPWLLNYITIMFDRTEQISNCYKKYIDLDTVMLDIKIEKIQPYDFDNFMYKIQQDEWNYFIYLRIIKELYPNTNYIKIKYRTKSAVLPITSNSLQNFKNKLWTIYDKLAPFLQNEQKYFFHTSYINKTRFTLLNFLLGQIPRKNDHYFNKNFNYKLDTEFRKESLGYEFHNEFEKILDKHILKDIPISYLENFNIIYNFIDNINLTPKVILSANSYWSNDVFKCWLAKNKLGKSKIVILDHGGAFPLNYLTFYHEEIISDKFVIWFNPYSELKHKQIQLPANKISRINPPNLAGTYCSYVGFESVRYGYRICAQPMNIQILYHFDDSIKLYNNLNKVIQKSFVVRPYTNMGWETQKRYEDELGNEKVISKEKQSYHSFIKNSKLIICSYPQTTFTEAMVSGKPCILFYNQKYNETVLEAQYLIDQLIDANIIFNCPQKAADHINNYWNCLDNWWLSDKVVNARLLFLRIAIKGDRNFIKEWYSFLKSSNI